jgi:hypothetical protein
MQNDILAQFRRTPSAGNGGTLPPREADEYAAFGTKDKLTRLRIRTASGLTHSPGYNLLTNIVYDGPEGTHFILVYTTLTVLVQGRNLHKMVFAIENAMADFIQEFNSGRWQKPTDADSAFIETIEVKVRDGDAPSE